MNRRQFLIGTVPVTLSLAGCNAGYDGPVRTEPVETEAPPSTPTASPTVTPRPTPEGYWRVVSMEEQDSVADRHQVSMQAEVGESWITAEHTAWITVTLTNHASHVRTFYDFANPEVKRGFLDDEGALLGSSTNPPDCIGTDGKRPGPFGEGRGLAEKELQPDESVTIVYGLFDDPRISGCISPGTYRFGWRFSYKDAPADEEEAGGTTYAPIRWGLTLEVTAPE
jgi:hypothetical protein